MLLSTEPSCWPINNIGKHASQLNSLAVHSYLLLLTQFHIFSPSDLPFQLYSDEATIWGVQSFPEGIADHKI